MVDLTCPIGGVAVLALLCSLCTLWTPSTDAEKLNDYILDYQALTFNPLHLEAKHERVKRNADPFLRWNFRAYGRTFNLKLSPATSMFAPNHHMVVDQDRENVVDTSHIYEGTLAGDSTSRVHLAINNGSLLGFIQTQDHPTYHIEPANKYFKHAQFHSIIYPENRMNLDPYRHKRAAGQQGTSCFGSSLYDKLSSMSQPVEETSNRKKRDLSKWELNNPYAKYSAKLNKDQKLHRRYRRDLTSGETTCFMSIRADQILYNHYKDDLHGGDGEKAKKDLLSMFSIHIAAINRIYESTTFKYRSSDTPTFRGVRFQLQRSTIITECDGSTWDNAYCTNNLDVSNFLDLTSRKNHDQFCLVHTFTYRDFVGGTLGLAWVATPESRASGVCGKYGRVSDNGKISSKSLNTGITTLINFNQEVASRVSQLTFAHEVGHNFGAQHDSSGVCAPYGTSQSDASDGNYIMYPSANTGNLKHNSMFSVCSKDDIAKVLNSMGSVRTYCFKSSEEAFCGNKIVEKGEDCDCGYLDDCDDKCCTGRSENGDNADSMCKRPDTVVCSPTEGPCCNKDCRFVESGPCASATGCTMESNCVPNQATCPEPSKQEDNSTFCDNNDKVCVGGECLGSVCLNIGWRECFMTESQVSEEEEMCYVACQKDASSECVSSFDTTKINEAQFSEFKTLLETIQTNKGASAAILGVKRPAGSTCNYGKGYCDIFSKCRSYDAEGPFRQLTKLIFNPVTFQSIWDWCKDHWWAVLLMGVGVVVFMAVFVKLFGYNTPSQDPKKKRRAQPMPRTNPNADKRAGKPKRGGGGNKGGAAYTTDVPLHDNTPFHRDQGHQNQGYQDYNNPYSVAQGSSRGPHQQYDRIAGTRY